MTVKKTILDSLRSRKFRYGGLRHPPGGGRARHVVGVNLVVDQVRVKLDMAQDRLYSLSDQTKKLLSGLTVDVTSPPSAGRIEDKLVKEVLDRMAMASRHIRLTVKPRDEPRIGQNLREDR